MIDEAFMPFREVVERLMAFPAAVSDEAAGVRASIYACELELPVELDIVRAGDGTLQIGSTPPLYHLDTSVRPSFHQVRFVAETAEGSHGDD